MRNVWKGLVVGGLTGVTAGVVLDSITRVSNKATQIGSQVRDKAPEAGRLAHSFTDKAGDWIHHAEVSDHVRDAARRVKESDAAQRAADAGGSVVAAVEEVAHSHSH